MFSASARGLPPRRPHALAPAKPAWVRSQIRVRSNSASAPKTWKTSLPVLVVVSTFSVRLRKPMARACNAVMVAIKRLRNDPIDQAARRRRCRLHAGRAARRSAQASRASSDRELLSQLLSRDSVSTAEVRMNSGEGQVGQESNLQPAVLEPAAVRSAPFRDVHEGA